MNKNENSLWKLVTMKSKKSHRLHGFTQINFEIISFYRPIFGAVKSWIAFDVKYQGQCSYGFDYQ